MEIWYNLGVALFVIAGVILVGAVVAYVVSTVREAKAEQARELHTSEDGAHEDSGRNATSMKE